jgi:hypothetical protein
MARRNCSVCTRSSYGHTGIRGKGQHPAALLLDARLDSNQEVTPDAFVKGNLNYKVWGMASGIVDERWEGNWP